MSFYRPRGVTALAIIFIILAAIWIIFVVWFELLLVIDYNSIYRDLFFLPSLIYSQSSLPPLVILFILSNLATSIVEVLNLYISYGGGHSFTAAALILSGIFILDSVGLLKMKKWGYYLALIIGIFLIISLNIIGIILGIATLVYLLASHVKYEFE